MHRLKKVVTMFKLLLVPTKYEIHLLPEIFAYHRVNSYIYNFTFKFGVQALVGLTGIGKENVYRFLSANSNLIAECCTAVISIGTCGVHNIPEIAVGTCYITDSFFNGKDRCVAKIPSHFLSTICTDCTIGATKTVTEFFSSVNSIDKNKFSVDMEGLYLYEFCLKQELPFYNVRIVSDHCDISEHTDGLTIPPRHLDNYKNLVRQLIMDKGE